MEFGIAIFTPSPLWLWSMSVFIFVCCSAQVFQKPIFVNVSCDYGSILR